MYRDHGRKQTRHAVGEGSDLVFEVKISPRSPQPTTALIRRGRAVVPCLLMRARLFRVY